MPRATKTCKSCGRKSKGHIGPTGANCTMSMPTSPHTNESGSEPGLAPPLLLHWANPGQQEGPVGPASEDTSEVPHSAGGALTQEVGLAILDQLKLLTLSLCNKDTLPGASVNGTMPGSCANGTVSLPGVSSEVLTSAVPAPGVPAPGVLAPGVPAPGVLAPGVPAPGVLTPGVPAPGVLPPGVPAPGVPAPGVPTPGVAAPGVTAPGVPAPAAAESGVPRFKPPGVPNQALRQAINGEFVDLSQFLPTLGTGCHLINSELEPYLDEANAIHYRPKKPNRKVVNFDTWNEAWAEYEKFMVKSLGGWIHEQLSNYRSFIFDCNKKYN